MWSVFTIRSTLRSVWHLRLVVEIWAMTNKMKIFKWSCLWRIYQPVRNSTPTKDYFQSVAYVPTLSKSIYKMMHNKHAAILWNKNTFHKNHTKFINYINFFKQHINVQEIWYIPCILSDESYFQLTNWSSNFQASSLLSVCSLLYLYLMCLMCV